MSIEKPRPPSKFSRSGDYRDQPGYRRGPRIAATIIFWLFWVALVVLVAFLDATLVFHRPENMDTPTGWVLTAAMVATLWGIGTTLALIFLWAKKNRYK